MENWQKVQQLLCDNCVAVAGNSHVSRGSPLGDQVGADVVWYIMVHYGISYVRVCAADLKPVPQAPKSVISVKLNRKASICDGPSGPLPPQTL